MDQPPNTSGDKQLPPPMMLGKTNWGSLILSSGIICLFILWRMYRWDFSDEGGGEAFLEAAFMGLFAMVLLALQMGMLCLGAVGLILILLKKNSSTRRQTSFALAGMLCSVIFVFALFMPRYLERREQERLPREYKMWFPWVEYMLKMYDRRHGEYPPALMPYLVPRFWEHESAFPPDDYHKPIIQRYWHMNYGPHQWLDRGTTMSATVTHRDFDFTGYYRYYSDGKGYILIGNGPDYDADLDAKESFFAARKGDRQKLIINKYDPTNGADSGGDYYVIKLR